MLPPTWERLDCRHCILHPMHLMICSLMKSQSRVYSGLQLKPYKASAIGIFWYEQLNNVKCIFQCPPFIDSQDISRTHGWRGASGNKKFPGAMLPLFDQNLQTSCLNFLSRSSPSLPEVIQLHRNGAVLCGIPISTLVLVSNL